MDLSENERTPKLTALNLPLSDSCNPKVIASL